jgi:hypothetical protein
LLTRKCVSRPYTVKLFALIDYVCRPSLGVPFIVVVVVARDNPPREETGTSNPVQRRYKRYSLPAQRVISEGHTG